MDVHVDEVGVDSDGEVAENGLIAGFAVRIGAVVVLLQYTPDSLLYPRMMNISPVHKQHKRKGGVNGNRRFGGKHNSPRKRALHAWFGIDGEFV